LKHDSLTIFAAEMIVMLPVAIAIALTSATTHTVTSRPVLLTVMLPGLGLLSALSFTLYLKASRMLPMGIFGLLGYVEPILLAALSVTVFHEAIAPEEVWTFLPIALSVAATAVYVFTARPRPRRCRESADGRPGSHEAASGCHKA
jgi:chloramphenicol-sensitive protein RarD